MALTSGLRPEVTNGGNCIMDAGRESELEEYITTALLQLMKKKDYFRITITEICEKAGVSRMSFYRSFDGKLEVLQKKCAAITDEFVQSSGISYRDNTVRQYFVTLFTHFQKHRELILLLSRAGLLHIIKDDIDRVFLKTYEGVYDDYKSRFLSGGIYDVFLYWLKNGCQESPEDLAEKLSEILEK